MSKMISVASGFQYSVNIAYDLSSDDKIRNFIPTRSSVQLLKDILLSTQDDSNERSRILIGAYGKGKSHIVLTILSLLMKKDRNLFVRLNPIIEQDAELKHLVNVYYETKQPILPVVITGSNTSLNQAFLLALQRTLNENNLTDIMPKTNYQAAINVINRWKKEYPKTYESFSHMIDLPIEDFLNQIENYNIDAYQKFENIYKDLTSGSSFNPFLGFDVVEIYEDVAKGLKRKGYSGIYVVYDEFSKFLESNITTASVSDTKMLQDFAEKCNRSGSTQLHLMLISHKEIANYIDKLPKNKTDGWRGVSERFKHIHLNNNFTQTYDIIASVIQKDTILYSQFLKTYQKQFEQLDRTYRNHPIFDEMSDEETMQIIEKTYPLHPVSTFILPRLSERVAQNERTLFTFLSASGTSTLRAFLENYHDDCFKVMTPDMIYDYFEPLFKKEIYMGSLHDTYMLTSIILENLDAETLQSKIVKTLSLIYILEQFEKLQPTYSEIYSIFSIDYSREEVEDALNDLIEKEYVIYLRQSNHFLQLKQSSGVDINQMLLDVVEKQRKSVHVKDTLNETNLDKYLYPARYNDEKEMTRYFAFEFINEDEVTPDVNWSIKSESIHADGVIYAIIPKSEESLADLKERVIASSEGNEDFVFIVPKNYNNIEETVRRFNASETLMNSSKNEKILHTEYEVIHDDLYEVIRSYITSYSHPERFEAIYIMNGQVCNITRKAELTMLISKICDIEYAHTPVVINESINKDVLTTTAQKSRNKVISALLRNDLEKDLGLTGHGQDVAIMRTTLMRTGVLEKNDHAVSINLHTDHPCQIHYVLDTIVNFVEQAKQNSEQSFDLLYDALMGKENHIGLRKGLIPIYIACVIHEYKKEIVLLNERGECPINVDTLLQIDAQPRNYRLAIFEWDENKANYIKALDEIFAKNIKSTEKNLNSYDYIVSAMHRWMLSLPKYSRNIKKNVDKNRIPRTYLRLIKQLKQGNNGQKLLFESIPDIFKLDSFNEELIQQIKDFKDYYDQLLEQLVNYLIIQTKHIYATVDEDTLKQMSLSSVIRDWCETLDDSIYDQLFGDGTENCLSLFRNITNDEHSFIKQFARLATGLRIEDWNEDSILMFIKNAMKYKQTAENYVPVHNDENGNEMIDHGYSLSYVDDDGHAITKRFDRVDETGRGKLLMNAINAQLKSMGRAVSEQEKRQILMEILKQMC